MSWDHLAAICAITPQGKLYIMIQDRAFKGPNVVRFLRHLLRHVPGTLLIIWDSLPGYAPDLNPVEGIFHYLKSVELRSLCCQNLFMLHGGLRKAVARLRRKTDVILACIQHVYLGDPNFSSLC